jgi:hypothetical protein
LDEHGKSEEGDTVDELGDGLSAKASRTVGGMGVANIKFQNHALLTKWNVKLYTDTACL